MSFFFFRASSFSSSRPLLSCPLISSFVSMPLRTERAYLEGANVKIWEIQDAKSGSGLVSFPAKH